MVTENDLGMPSIPRSSACGMLTRLSEQLSKEKRAVAVTKRGKPVLVVIPWDLYESIVETMEIMEDVEMMNGIREGIKDMREGNLILHEEVKARLGGAY